MTEQITWSCLSHPEFDMYTLRATCPDRLNIRKRFTGAELAHLGFETILVDFVCAVDCWAPDGSAFLLEGVSSEPQNSQGKG